MNFFTVFFCMNVSAFAFAANLDPKTVAGLYRSEENLFEPEERTAMSRLLDPEEIPSFKSFSASTLLQDVPLAVRSKSVLPAIFMNLFRKLDTSSVNFKLDGLELLFAAMNKETDSAYSGKLRARISAEFAKEMQMLREELISSILSTQKVDMGESTDEYIKRTGALIVDHRDFWFAGQVPTPREQAAVVMGAVLKRGLSCESAVNLMSTLGWRGGVCFAAGTKVSTVNGSIDIEKIQVGQKVLTYDDEGQIVERPVIKTFARDRVPILEVVMQIGSIKKRIQTTEEHPFMILSDSGLIQEKAIDLKEGMRAIFVDQSRQISEATVIQTSFTGSTTRVYNITVADHHTYFVEGILVHNKL